MTTPEPQLPGVIVRLDLPEHGQLNLPLAGVGGRALAALVDIFLLVFASLLLALFLSLAVADQVLAAEIGMPAIIAALSLLPLLGPLYFELRWRGQTPGKRLLGLRVISVDGSVPSGGQLFLRNILRLVDFMPFGYLFGLIAMFVSARGQRLGDLVGGTLVIREDPRALEEVSGYAGTGTGGTDTDAGAPELHGIPEGILRGAKLLLDPSRQLDPAVRRQRAADLASLIRQHRPDLAQEDDQRLLETIRRALEGRA